MAETAKGIIFPKQQLEIVQVHDEKAYAGGAKFLLPITAKNLSLPQEDPLHGKSLRYTVFNSDLKTFVQSQPVGARFLTDIEERDRPDSEYGPDRNIVQIYQDGKPVSVRKGGGGYGKSPEIVRLEHELDLELEAVKRRSIEGQTAMAQVGNILTSQPVIQGEELEIDEEDWNRILGKYWQAVEKGLDNYLAPPPEKKTAPAVPNLDQKPQDSQQAVEKDAAISKDAPPITDPIKHVGDLLTRAAKLKPPVTRADFLEMLAVNDPKEIIDLEEAWKKAVGLSASRGTKSSEEKGDSKKTTVESSAESERLFE